MATGNTGETSESDLVRLDLGPNLQLIAYRLEHAEALFAVVDANRMHLRQWLPWVDATQSVDDIRTFIRGAMVQQADGLGFHCGIWLADEIVGTIGYHPIDHRHRSVSFGYWIAQAHEGQGIVTHSARLFTQYAFDVWNLHRVVITCATGNTRSRAIPERLGFVHEGTLREWEWLNDRWVDHEMYSLLEHEYRRAGWH